MKIKRPNIKTDRYWLNDYKDLWGNFILEYNKDKPLGKQLRPRHGDLYKALVITASSELKETNKELKETPENAIIDSSQWFPVSGSAHLMAKKLNGVSANTIRRAYDRLEKAGIIKRNDHDFRRLIGRGRIHTFRRKEVLINPDFLLIHDYINPNYTPVSPWLDETKKRGFQKEKITNCVGGSSIGTLLESNNNEIMPVQTVDKGVSHPVDQNSSLPLDKNPNKTQLDATPNLNGFAAFTSKNGEKTQENSLKTPKNETKKPDSNKESSAAAGQIINTPKTPQIPDKLAHLRKTLAMNFYNFMITMLFKFHDIYPAERTMAINYLAEKYFGTVTNEQDGQWFTKIYQWRISKAAKFIKTHEYDFSNWYPMAYLNVNNPKGFAATKAWYNKHTRDLQRKAYHKHQNDLRIAEDSALKEAINQYLNSPNVITFQRVSKFINNKIPHRHNEFIQMINMNL